MKNKICTVVEKTIIFMPLNTTDLQNITFAKLDKSTIRSKEAWTQVQDKGMAQMQTNDTAREQDRDTVIDTNYI